MAWAWEVSGVWGERIALGPHLREPRLKLCQNISDSSPLFLSSPSHDTLTLTSFPDTSKCHPDEEEEGVGEAAQWARAVAP